MALPGMTALATITLSGSASTVTFSSIPSSYRDLRLVVTNTLSVSATNGFIQINGDTGTNYARVQAIGNGSTTSSYTATGDNGFYGFQLGGTNAPGVFTADFIDYAQTDKHKTILMRSGEAGTMAMMSANRWGNTAAITSFVISPGSGTFSAGSMFSLYGIAG